jgi:hypothetical protein
MLRAKENKMKSCVKFVCSTLKKLLLYSLHLTVSVALENWLQRRKGIFYKMERTQFTQYFRGKVCPPPPPPKHVLSRRTLILCLRAICSAGTILQSPMYRMVAHKSSSLAARDTGTLIPCLPSHCYCSEFQTGRTV